MIAAKIRPLIMKARCVETAEQPKSTGSRPYRDEGGAGGNLLDRAAQRHPEGSAQESRQRRRNTMPPTSPRWSPETREQMRQPVIAKSLVDLFRNGTAFAGDQSRGPCRPVEPGRTAVIRRSMSMRRRTQRPLTRQEHGRARGKSQKQPRRCRQEGRAGVSYNRPHRSPQKKGAWPGPENGHHPRGPGRSRRRKQHRLETDTVAGVEQIAAPRDAQTQTLRLLAGAEPRHRIRGDQESRQPLSSKSRSMTRPVTMTGPSRRCSIVASRCEAASRISAKPAAEKTVNANTASHQA